MVNFLYLSLSLGLNNLFLIKLIIFKNLFFHLFSSAFKLLLSLVRLSNSSSFSVILLVKVLTLKFNASLFSVSVLIISRFSFSSLSTLLRVLDSLFSTNLLVGTL